MTGKEKVYSDESYYEGVRFGALGTIEALTEMGYIVPYKAANIKNHLLVLDGESTGLDEIEMKDYIIKLLEAR